jgi:hypothetical protein
MAEYFRDDIIIEFHIGRGGDVDPKLLVEALDILEGALYASDRTDIERVSSQLPIPTYVRDASLERLRNYRHHRVHFREATTGSIVLIGAVAAVSLFVLEKTIGEAFTDGFKDTRTYHELRTFFREQIDSKALFIAEAIRRGLGTRHRTADVSVIPPHQQSTPGHRIVIAVQGPSTDRQLPPSLGETLDKPPGTML